MDCYTEIIILYFFTKSVNILKEAFGEDGLSIFIHLITIYGSCLYSIPFPNKGCIFSKTRFVEICFWKNFCCQILLEKNFLTWKMQCIIINLTLQFSTRNFLKFEEILPIFIWKKFLPKNICDFHSWL